MNLFVLAHNTIVCGAEILLIKNIRDNFVYLKEKKESSNVN
jgi:hypothetical protein